MCISTNELQWVIGALNKEIAAMREDYSHAEDGSAMEHLAELLIDNRTALIQKFTDVINSGTRRITVV